MVRATNGNHRFQVRDDRGRFKPKADEGCPDPDCDGEVSSSLMPSGSYKQQCDSCPWWVMVG